MDISDLPTELFHGIIKKLANDQIANLSRVSHAHRAKCEPFIFRNITLSDRRKSYLRISQRILDRLQDPNDGIVYSVQQISVGYTASTENLSEKALLRALRNVRTLESFTWCTWIPISTQILECLEEVHPSAYLRVAARERNSLPLDKPLISSPQLHTLDIKISVLYNKNFRNPMGKSELDQLKSLLMKGGNLKILRLQFEKIKHGSKTARALFEGHGPAICDPVTFKFEDQDMLPALEELVVRDMFEWNEAHNRLIACEAWRKYQDWGALRILDLRLDGCEEMLQCLTSAIPQLRTLKVRIRSPAVLQGFLGLVPYLTHLDVDCESGLYADLLPIIYRTVSPHLESLEMVVGSHLQTWRAPQFQDEQLSKSASPQPVRFTQSEYRGDMVAGYVNTAHRVQGEILGSVATRNAVHARAKNSAASLRTADTVHWRRVFVFYQCSRATELAGIYRRSISAGTGEMRGRTK